MKKLLIIAAMVAPLAMFSQSSTQGSSTQGSSTQGSSTQGTESGAARGKGTGTGAPAASGGDFGKGQAQGSPAMGGMNMGGPGMAEKPSVFIELVMVSDGKDTKFTLRTPEDLEEHFPEEFHKPMLEQLKEYKFQSVADGFTFLSGLGWQYLEHYKSPDPKLAGTIFLFKTNSMKRFSGRPGAGGPGSGMGKGDGSGGGQNQGKGPEKGTEKDGKGGSGTGTGAGTGTGKGNGGVTVAPKK